MRSVTVAVTVAITVAGVARLCSLWSTRSFRTHALWTPALVTYVYQSFRYTRSRYTRSRCARSRCARSHCARTDVKGALHNPILPQADSEEVWEAVKAGGDAGASWYKASVAIDAHGTEPWSVTAIGVDGTAGKRHVFGPPRQAAV